MAVHNFDLIVIGTGTAGSTAAYRCRSAGWQVAIIDSLPFGGTCKNRGCDPKKVLVGAAELVDWNRRMKGHGVRGDGVIDWPALMQLKKTFTDTVPQDCEQSYAAAGMAAFHGRAHFVDRETLSLGEDLLKARNFVIAAGARPVALDIPGEEHLMTSTDFLELGRLPKRIVFVGGGYISFEFAHIAARAGSDVRIVNRGDRPLKAFDPDLVQQLVSATVEIGVEVKNNAAVRAIEKRSDGLAVLASVHGREEVFEAEMVVHGAGRVPDIDDLGLEQGGIERESGGIVVNDYLQSISNPAAYAAGDAVASGRPLTPSAGLQGAIVSRNVLGGNKHKPDYRGMASVVFSVPPLAAVGLSESEARERGFDFETNHGDTSGWYNSRRVGETHGGYKVLIERSSEKILGAHLLGSHADDVINLFAIAIRFGLKASELRQVPFAYPTYSYDLTYMV